MGLFASGGRWIKTNGGTFNLMDQEGRWSFYNYCAQHPEDSAAIQFLSYWLEAPAWANDFTKWQQNKDTLEQAATDGQGALQGVAIEGRTLDQTGQNYVDNQIGRENVTQDQSYQTSMRDTSVLSTADQLSQLGLSTSNVVTLGGASSGVSSSPASVNHHSPAALKQQLKMNSFNNKMGLAKSLIGAASSMASSGIYGAALGAVRNAGAKIAGAAAHSGLQALESMRPEMRNQIMKDAAARHWSYGPSQPEDNISGYLI